MEFGMQKSRNLTWREKEAAKMVETGF